MEMVIYIALKGDLINLLEWIKKITFLKCLFILFLLLMVLGFPTLIMYFRFVGGYNKEFISLVMQYYGSLVSAICGGLITYYGVYITIKNNKVLLDVELEVQDKARKDSLEVQYSPILLLDQNISQESFLLTKDFYQFQLSLKNVGMGEAKNISVYVIDPNDKISKIFTRNYLMSHREINFSFVEDSFPYTPLGVQPKWKIVVKYQSKFGKSYKNIYHTCLKLVDFEKYNKLQERFHFDDFKLGLYDTSKTSFQAFVEDEEIIEE